MKIIFKAKIVDNFAYRDYSYHMCMTCVLILLKVNVKSYEILVLTIDKSVCA
jgi:hypothetical protein